MKGRVIRGLGPQGPPTGGFTMHRCPPVIVSVLVVACAVGVLSAVRSSKPAQRAVRFSVVAPQSPSSPDGAPDEVYAVRYGVLPQFRVSGLVAGADPSRRLDIPVAFWVVKGPGGRVFLVDCGFYRGRLIEQWKVKDYVKPSVAIAALGLQPQDVTDIVITHMHWDHAGSLDLFPKATVWMQRDEFADHTGDAWQPGGAHGGIEPDDVLAVVRANTEGRLRLLGKDQEILPGLDAHQGGLPYARVAVREREDGRRHGRADVGQRLLVREPREAGASGGCRLVVQSRGAEAHPGAGLRRAPDCARPRSRRVHEVRRRCSRRRPDSIEVWPGAAGNSQREASPIRTPRFTVTCETALL